MYERLYKEAAHQGISIYEKPMHYKIKGLYADNVIWINRDVPTTTEKTCILAEELGHYQTTVGDITDQSNSNNRKQERRAREWAYEKLVPLRKIVEAHRARITSRHELAEFLGVTEEFLQAALNRYMDKHGSFIIVDEQYTIMFDPLMVVERFE
jgi:Zn-dependent peptidase ImmA (M78 family)